MKFRLRPVEIEAGRFDPDQPWPEGVYPLSHYLRSDAEARYCQKAADTPFVRTPQGLREVRAGDWVVPEHTSYTLMSEAALQAKYEELE